MTRSPSGGTPAEASLLTARDGELWTSQTLLTLSHGDIHDSRRESGEQRGIPDVKPSPGRGVCRSRALYARSKGSRSISGRRWKLPPSVWRFRAQVEREKISFV
jgi:hypothetical protein